MKNVNHARDKSPSFPPVPCEEKALGSDFGILLSSLFFLVTAAFVAHFVHIDLSWPKKKLANTTRFLINWIFGKYCFFVLLIILFTTIVWNNYMMRPNKSPTIGPWSPRFCTKQFVLCKRQQLWPWKYLFNADDVGWSSSSRWLPYKWECVPCLLLNRSTFSIIDWSWHSTL